jgi:Asp-tRNA(Asn)/Glu-tRNA(Gln) amidotransferase A subunit family amidase
MPCFPVVAPFHHQTIFTNAFDFAYAGVMNSLGFPVTQCPMGLCPKTGLPIGIQCVANFKNDHLTIRLAEFFEKNVGGWVPPY